MDEQTNKKIELWKKALLERILDPQLRRDAVWNLYNFEYKDALPLLINILTNKTEDVSVRQCAAIVIVRMSNQQAIEPLISILSDEDSNVRLIAIVALTEINDTQVSLTALPALEYLVCHEQVSLVKDAAMEAIRYINSLNNEFESNML